MRHPRYTLGFPYRLTVANKQAIRDEIEVDLNRIRPTSIPNLAKKLRVSMHTIYDVAADLLDKRYDKQAMILVPQARRKRSVSLGGRILKAAGFRDGMTLMATADRDKQQITIGLIEKSTA